VHAQEAASQSPEVVEYSCTSVRWMHESAATDGRTRWVMAAAYDSVLLTSTLLSILAGSCLMDRSALWRRPSYSLEDWILVLGVKLRQLLATCSLEHLVYYFAMYGSCVVYSFVFNRGKCRVAWSWSSYNMVNFVTQCDNLYVPR
jgi:hypothetical protein